MRRYNVLTDGMEQVSDRDGYEWRATRHIGERLGATRIGASVYELPQGQRTFPYHFHHGVEEWLYVVSGAPVLRTPEGERTLAPGDLCCFPSGSAGAHALRGPGRMLIFSANRAPSISVYPDSDKVAPRPEDQADPDRLNFRRGDAVGYWDGE